jgi:hypothetical protein
MTLASLFATWSETAMVIGFGLSCLAAFVAGRFSNRKPKSPFD